MRRLTLPLLCLALPALAWEARPLKDIAVHPERGAQAQVVSLNESRVAAEVAGRILELPVEPGQGIARGAVLARLDCTDHDLGAERALAALKAGEARARLAELSHQRGVRLAGEGFISTAALDTQAAELAAARAELAVQAAALKTARTAQSRCVVRAPFPAVVLERLAQVGEAAAPGGPLVVLLDRSRIEVKAEVQAEDAEGMRSARDLVFAGPAGRQPLRLVRLSPAIARATRLIEARLRFASQPAAPGASGRVSWTTAAPHLPPELVVRRRGRLGVYVAQGQSARFHPLPQAQEGRPAAATGLTPTSLIVTTGLGALN